MKVGCIGLGDIAQKAYLPVLALQPGIELHLQTRTPATLHRVAESLHVTQDRRHTDLDALLAQDLDAAFVHAPTAAHPEIVTRLLEAGVPTYVDKPLAYRLADSERLVRLAENAERQPGGRIQPALRARVRAVRRPPARADPHAEEPDGAARGAAHDGPRRLHPRRRHAAVPGSRPGRRRDGARPRRGRPAAPRRAAAVRRRIHRARRR